jgi:hypothetical protein
LHFTWLAIQASQYILILTFDIELLRIVLFSFFIRPVLWFILNATLIIRLFHSQDRGRVFEFSENLYYIRRYKFALDSWAGSIDKDGDDSSFSEPTKPVFVSSGNFHLGESIITESGVTVDELNLYIMSYGGDGTFDFFGFTHYWGRSRNGSWVVKRQTIRKRQAKAMRSIYFYCHDNRHELLITQLKGLSIKLRGIYNYYGIRCNYRPF